MGFFYCLHARKFGFFHYDWICGSDSSFIEPGEEKGWIEDVLYGGAGSKECGFANFDQVSLLEMLI